MSEYILQLTPTELLLLIVVFLLGVLGAYFVGKTVSFQQLMGEFMRNSQKRVNQNVQDMKNGIDDLNRQVGGIGKDTEEIMGSMEDMQNEIEQEKHEE
ncbi:hypothetical protein [Methanonatronarchaeum sp. AMET6-2]|uniref:hypothetical protein n=1 Tax=Methanonatronarchaeum sp. AMET6-2 TaxID=2933293 RepID=UPI0011FDD664|nr:hypothetical protein [Methanonatronarchaeum sp. AMET6-2]RZN61680.1 MAG: hypothetical protein EF811_04945 [Methanonatronarchaeia archaeon]UOY10076.1 hypothetical protein MU439_00065 [Methanonatronarchaeum sp. AMET6-2]